MNFIDFIIGLTLMNAMPHFVLGVRKTRMMSGFGVGNTRNIVWGLSNFAVSIGLFIYQYGLKGFVENGIYSGALLVLLAFFGTTWFWMRYFGGGE